MLSMCDGDLVLTWAVVIDEGRGGLRGGLAFRLLREFEEGSWK